MKILYVDPGSPLFGYVRPGYRIVSVNGREVIDTIDLRYKLAEERVTIVFADPAGRELSFDFAEDEGAGESLAAGLGLTLDDSRIRTCKCDCIFCFVRQQPTGMRRALYTKDEDYRLSFTHGNFITLSNMTEADLARIIEQRLSPLYISVHAADDTLRRCMLRNEKLAPIVPTLRRLGGHGITMHTQVVLCPGINDGEALAQTIDELAALFPQVATLAVVPVGLTRFREGQTKLRTYTREEAGGIIDYIERRQKVFRRERGSRFVWPADEFYVLGGRTFPNRAEYEDMAQFENGIGMVRETITGFNRRRAMLRKVRGRQRVLFLTGESARPFLESHVAAYARDQLGLRLEVEAVKNEFWGPTVTVSGLLTGQDLLRHARRRHENWDVLVVPPNCLNDDDLFLDNLSLEQFRGVLAKPVLVGQYNVAASLKEAFS
ncbi:MAG TPA: DUF512 domain-containing protein [candidate division Zixibacteria bacterium]|nr:DUF512 domain-containing protein [candidate division Zixibacteria bacterium]MDD4917124.1 DUF512 domain-containing protein [candidate division Zixibacteria bacterium]MDM7972692.1 DUF512 domain-containing protein [candidate division Zixibacteria bacterium]HOD65393.1 DUF512 domain-containing protein [candidate division Zixibacteria bacterium]HPC10722.1 DUF512 domain-containing protein [candidate division Zixibacteria bacterium]